MGNPSQEEDVEVFEPMTPTIDGGGEDDASSVKSPGSGGGSVRSLRQALFLLKKRMSAASSTKVSVVEKSETPSSARGGPKSLEEELEELNLAPPNYECVFIRRHFDIKHIPNKKKDWATDVIITPNNGIRAELNDLYNLFSIMEKRPLQLDVGDIELLFRWCNVFNRIVENFFELEEVCLFEWIEGRDLMIGSSKYWKEPDGKIDRGIFSNGRRKKRRGEILAIMREVMDFKSRFVGYPVLQVLPEFAETVEQLVLVLEQYMNDKENVLVQVIEKRFTRKDRSRYDKKFWNKVQELEDGDLTMIAMMRWMSKKEERSWIMRMKSMKIISKDVVKDWMERFNVEHREVVGICENKLRLAIEEKKAQIKIHENAVQRAVSKSKLSCLRLDTASTDGRQSGVTLEESRLTSLVSDSSQ